MSTTLARARDLLPLVAKRAGEAERSGSLCPEVLDALTDAGCLRMAAPARYGGDDLAMPEILRVVETLAEADASVGWALGQAVIAQLIFAHFPAGTVAEIYAAGPDVLGAGAVAPKGRARRRADGWVVSGRWPFVTGCRHASWIYLQCLVVDDDGVRTTDEGLPELRLVVVPAAEVRVIETWRGLGLAATGSHDVQLSRVSCPPERSCSFAATPQVPSTVSRIPARDQGGLVVAATACGIASAALDAVVALAVGGKRPAFSPNRLANSPLFQDRLGEARLTLDAARALLYERVTAADELAVGAAMTARERARLRATAPKVTDLATAVTTTAYALGGGSAVFDGSPLQRLLRDAHTATQHFSAGRDHYGAFGAALVGEEIGEENSQRWPSGSSAL
jgi:alkylation response protein AidB-like acyl-CoA dehydrogenase